MAKRKVQRKPGTSRQSKIYPGPGSEPGGRVAWLLENVWAGNRSAMGKDVGCSHSVLVKIAAGAQSPGRRLLSAIAEYPKVNPAWIFTGIGDPLLAPSANSPDGWRVPIARHLLPGSPEQFKELLSGEYYPVPDSLYQASRYWFEIQDRSPVERNDELQIKTGDLLLMETAKSYCTRLDSVNDRICGVQIKRPRQEPEIQLCRIEHAAPSTDEPGYLNAISLVPPIDKAKMVRETVIRQYPNRPPEITSSELYDCGAVHGKRMTRRTRSLEYFPASKSITLDDILAACVLLVRRFI